MEDLALQNVEPEAYVRIRISPDLQPPCGPWKWFLRSGVSSCNESETRQHALAARP